MSDAKDDGAARVVRDFRAAVNMTVAELRDWLGTEESRSVGWTHEGESESVGHEMGGHIVRLLEGGTDDPSEEDAAHMRKVVGYVHRHMAQGGPAEDKEHSRWRHSLMNWGHDPMKGDRPAARRRAPARKPATAGGTGRRAPGTAKRTSASRTAAASRKPAAKAPARKPAARKAAAKPAAAKRTPARSAAKATAARKAPARTAARPATKAAAAEKAAPKRAAPAKAPARKAVAKPAAKKAAPKARAVSTKGPAKGLRPGTRAAQSALGRKGAAVRRGAAKKGD